MKNIVICCDGTGNQLNETYSNVVKLYMCLDKNPAVQMTFYDPGVGTMSDPNVVTPFYKWVSKLGGLAFGWGLKSNVEEAYKFLMDHHEEGDLIYIYGFSRGAYTARVLAGMIHSVGLLAKGSGHLFPYAFKAYKSNTNKKGYQIAKQFKKIYARDVSIHFMGIWDTVTSIGLFGLRTYPYTTNNSSIRKVRHAVAIDERRAYYRQNLFNAGETQDVKQVWFAGVHSDVGGSYSLSESGLAQVSLEWMLKESDQLVLNAKLVDEVLRDSLGVGDSVPDPCGKLHDSLTIWWWPLEIMPKIKLWFPWIKAPNFGRRRKMHVDSRGNTLIPSVHVSVVERMKKMPQYKPTNLIEPYKVESTN